MKLAFIFALITVAVADIRFVAHGDWGDSASDGQTRQTYVAAIMDQWCSQDGKGCDFIMSLADNFYPNGATSVDDDRFNYNWRDVYTGESIKDLTWYITVGNHDHNNGNEPNQLEFGKTEPKWYMPNYYYGFEMDINDGDAATIFFYAMDSESLRLNKHDPAAQLAEMETMLSETTAQWKIVFGHHPPLSVGRRDGDSVIFNQVVPILEDNNVDFLMAGHDHNLQHIQKINNVDIDYIVSGAGARSLYEYDSSNENTIRNMGYQPIFFGYNYGFVGVTVTNDELKTEFFSYSLSGNDASIEKLYEFSRYKA